MVASNNYSGSQGENTIWYSRVFIHTTCLYFLRFGQRRGDITTTYLIIRRLERILERKVTWQRMRGILFTATYGFARLFERVAVNHNLGLVLVTNAGASRARQRKCRRSDKRRSGRSWWLVNWGGVGAVIASSADMRHGGQRPTRRKCARGRGRWPEQCRGDRCTHAAGPGLVKHMTKDLNTWKVSLPSPMATSRGDIWGCRRRASISCRCWWHGCGRTSL